MSPAQQAKEAGLNSLAQVSELTGVSPQTLANWAKDKPDLFRVALAGCKALHDRHTCAGMTDRELLESIARATGAELTDNDWS